MSYPFSALVGQIPLKLALILNAINPALGGLLIQGQHGTAKSTAARSLANLLPAINVAELDVELRTNNQLEYVFLPRLPHTPFVELPLNVTADRLLGQLTPRRDDLPLFEMGLLGQAHQGVLYVDDINLLPRPMLNLLLDATASGLNHVERAGVSASHSAQFILLGTMNPTEGALPSQIVDRFGLMVNLRGETDLTHRAELVQRRIAYEQDPIQFCDQFIEAEQMLQQRITEARNLMPMVTVSESMVQQMSQLCLDNHVEGLRADISLYKTAQTLAAWLGREQVLPDDIEQAAEFVLPHRRCCQ